MIYLAAPFFTPEQVAILAAVERTLDEVGLKYFSPRKESGVLNTMAPAERAASLRRVFISNVRAIEEATLLLAGVDFKDTGTVWEQGFFYGYSYAIGGTSYRANDDDLISVPMMTYSFSGKQANVMLSQSSAGHFTGLDDLYIFMRKARAYANFPTLTRSSWMGAAAEFLAHGELATSE